MPIKDFDTFKTVLDEYLGIVTEVEDGYGEEILLTVRAGKDKPALLRLEVADLGNGWKIGCVTYLFEMDAANEVLRNYIEVK